MRIRGILFTSIELKLIELKPIELTRIELTLIKLTLLKRLKGHYFCRKNPP